MTCDACEWRGECPYMEPDGRACGWFELDGNLAYDRERDLEGECGT